MRDDLIRLTKIENEILEIKEVIVNPDRFQLGRSIYLCKSAQCINLAIKEKKIQKMLRTSTENIEKVISSLEKTFSSASNISVLDSRKAVLAR